MITSHRPLLLSVLAVLLGAPPAARAQTAEGPADPPPAAAPSAPAATSSETPLVEVVFVLDTTGSMSNLIQGAKDTIWSIANRIADGDPVPDLRFGLVAYRDRGDEYVTRQVPLTADLDHVYAELMKFTANGGGDGPEHVNAALHDAVYGFDWTADDDRVLKLVFLVGDAPPHMDYDDGKDYRDICQEAVRRGLVINTIRCGGDESCATFWSDIAKRSEGRFTSIGQDGGVTTVSTPVDGRLAELSTALTDTHLGYGDRDALRRARELKGPGAAPASEAAAADKAEFSMKKAGYVAEHDLLDALRDGAVALGDLAEEEMPEELRELDDAARATRIAELRAKRDGLVKEIEAASAERQRFLAEEAAKRAGSGRRAFDAEVLEMLREQAGRKGIRYAAPAAPRAGGDDHAPPDGITPSATTPAPPSGGPSTPATPPDGGGRRAA